MKIIYGNELYDVDEVVAGFSITFPDHSVKLLKLTLDENRKPAFRFAKAFPGSEDLAPILGAKIMTHETELFPRSHNE